MSREKEVTIYDIAEALNLSASTVSRGLRNHSSIKQATRDRIMAKANELGYQHNTFASSLRKRRTHTIGLVLPRLNSYFQSEVIHGIERVLNKQGYSLIISQSNERMEGEVAAVNAMFNSRVDGLLFSLAYETENIDHLEMFFRKKIPVVFFDRIFERRNYHNVLIDNYKAAYDMTTHLVNQGCRRIAHLGGSLVRAVYSERFEGYGKAIKNAGFEIDRSLLSFGPLDEDQGDAFANRILDLDEMPDGIFAANDVCAVACCCRLKKNGIRIPEDICIGGFNNAPISRVVEPNLTTINYPGKMVGETAAQKLIDILDSEKDIKPRNHVLDHQLIVRDSTSRVKIETPYVQ